MDIVGFFKRVSETMDIAGFLKVMIAVVCGFLIGYCKGRFDGWRKRDAQKKDEIGVKEDEIEAKVDRIAGRLIITKEKREGSR